MRKLFVLFIIAICFTNDSVAQSVGIGTSTPHTSSMLEIKGSDKGLLIPRTSTTSRLAISNPAKGLIIYDTTASSFWYHNGTAWSQIGNAADSGWSLTGNGNTDSLANFIGTTNTQALVFKVNSRRAGFLGYGTSNTSFGYNALTAITSGNYNTANGTGSLLANTTGFNNAAYGSYALSANNTGSFNTAFGSDALHNSTGGNNNSANGYQALYYNTTGNSNTADGYFALFNNTTGYSNISIGDHSLFSNTTQTNNVAVGDSALFNNGISTVNGQAIGNTAIGSQTLYSNTTGTDNTANGFYALYSNTTGYYNTAIGGGALIANTIGDFNTALGHGSGVNTGGLNYTTAIGLSATVTASNQVRIGSVGSYTSPTSIGGSVSWSTLSDGRVKKNIKENVPGLSFITKLTPVTYTVDNDAVNKIIQRPAIKDKDGKILQPSIDELSAMKANTAIVHTGFVAQDVEKVAKSLNYDFSGVDAAKNDKDLYCLRYADFVVPLVRAVQEQQQIITSQKNDIELLKAQLADLTKAVNKLISK